MKTLLQCKGEEHIPHSASPYLSGEGKEKKKKSPLTTMPGTNASTYQAAETKRVSFLPLRAHQEPA